MIYVRKSEDRGHADHGWLKAKHTFSFADYYDPNYMGFSVLRVINEDKVDGGMGFHTHGHKDMEIITYIIEGELQHKDSMGNTAFIRPGEIQRMSAGTGVRHSEFNSLKDKTTHLLQIWILPEKNGIEPSYAQKSFEQELKTNDLILVASKEGVNGSVTLNQDIYMYAAKSTAAGEKTITTQTTRHLWLQVIKGEVVAENNTLTAGDGAAIVQISSLNLKWSPDSEFILFDMV